MSEYNQYITAINKIFDYLSKMKVGWTGVDNINYIENIEEYKNIVVNSLNLFTENPEVTNDNVQEVLGDDW